jgi:serine/threonine protein phosphatase PrpC
VAVETLEDVLDGEAVDGPESRAAILTGIELANEAIRGAGNGSATTLIAAEVGGATLRSYHVGDSELLVVGQRGKVRHKTLSHSPVGYAVASGMLDEKDALHHEERHVISNMLGAPDMRIELSSILPLAPRDTVVLGTDGLFDNLHTDEIVEIVRKGPLCEVAVTLAKRCDRRMRTPGEGKPSKPDDLTFILFRQA